MRNYFSFIKLTSLIPGLLAAYFVTACTAPNLPTSQKNIISNAVVSNIEVSAWANEAAMTALSYNFAEYHQNFQAASRYFLPNSWAAYVAVLKQSGNFDSVIKKKLVVSAVAKGAPVVLNQGFKNNTYVWDVQIPMVMTFQSAHDSEKQDAIVDMHIVKVSGKIGVRGLAVQYFVVQ